MTKRYTDEARAAIEAAHQAVQQYNHAMVGTEHLLLGLIEELFTVFTESRVHEPARIRKCSCGCERWKRETRYDVIVCKKCGLSYDLEEGCPVEFLADYPASKLGYAHTSVVERDMIREND